MVDLNRLSGLVTERKLFYLSCALSVYLVLVQLVVSWAGIEYTTPFILSTLTMTFAGAFLVGIVSGKSMFTERRVW